MEVVTIESEAFKRLVMLIERAGSIAEPDRIMSVSEAAQYVGVNRRWIDARKQKIGYYQEGRVIKLRKSAIDKYLDKLTIKPRK